MSTVLTGRRKPRSLAQELVDALGERIRTGALPPGTKLPTEAAVMEEFGVSRTVVREAISKLQAAGLVDTRHGVGTFVVGLTPDSDRAARQAETQLALYRHTRTRVKGIGRWLRRLLGK